MHPRHFRWKPKDGNLIAIKDLADDHISNLINWMRRENDEINTIPFDVVSKGAAPIIEKLQIKLYKNNIWIGWLRDEINYRAKHGIVVERRN